MSGDKSVTDRLREAYETVVAAELPEHLQEEALRLAFEAGAESPGGKRQQNGTDRSDGLLSDEEEEDSNEQPSEQEFFSRFARNAELPELVLREVYYLDNNGEVGINLRGRDLGENLRARTATLATLMAGAYSLGVGTRVSAETIRRAAKSMQALDTNFSKAVRSNPNVSYIGPAKSKEIHLKSGAEDNFKELVLQLVGHSSDDA